MTEAERDKRITQVDVDPDLPVHSAWDLGMDDSTAIWCFQINGPELRIVDYYEASGHGAEHYASWLNQNKYRGVDWVPHDARVREWGSGRSRLETLRMLGRKPRIVPDHSLMDGIQAARITIPLASFDAARCARGIECLRSYQAERDENLRTYKRTPKHDFASHAADSWRYLAMAWKEPVPPDEELDPIADLLRPRTMDEHWRDYVSERVDQGDDPDQFLELN
jgi:hypothetical protein